MNQPTGKMIWVSPTTIAVNRLVAVTRPQPYRQACNCGLCRKKNIENDIPNVDSHSLENSV